MRDRRNVRVHFVGHADSQPLSEGLARVYGDNAGLSRERAGEVAEFFQLALGLPPEAISFEWAGETRPIASNATSDGRALNRRVEVEVWYDQPKESLREEEVLVAADFKQIKVCRVETVCKMRYMEGHSRRARVRNLVAPLRYEDDTTGLTEEFTRQVRQAVHNLREQAERADTLHRLHRRRAADRPRGEHLRQSSGAVKGQGAPCRACDAGNARAPEHRVRKRWTRRVTARRVQRHRAGTRAQSARRGRILVRRSSAGAAR